MTKSRKELRRKALVARSRRRALRTWGGIAVVVVILGGLLAWQNLRPMPGEKVADLGNRHLAEGQTYDDFNSRPPTSGPHYNSKASDGIHTEPIPDELQVHNLEDGGVMVQYNCPAGCDELVTQLTGVVSSYNSEIILAPYPDMESRIALTAWGRIDRLNDFDENRIVAFIEAYRGIDHHR